MEGSGNGLILLRRLPEETENKIDFREDSRFSGEDFNPGPSEYEAGVLAIDSGVRSSQLMSELLFELSDRSHLHL